MHSEHASPTLFPDASSNDALPRAAMPGVPHSGEKARRAGPSAAYIGLWAILAGCGLAYLATAAVRPEALADYSALALRHGGARIATADATADASSDTQTLRDTVGRLQGEVSRLSANIIASEERAGQLAEKLALLDKQPAATGDVVTTAAVPASPAQASPVAAASPASALARKFADAKPAADAKRVAAAAPAKPTAAATAPPTILNPAAIAQPIETGSIQPPAPSASAAPAASTPPAPVATPPAAAAPIAFGAPVVTPAPRNLGIQIANGSSVDALRLSWSLLSERHADSLKALEPRYTAGSGDDPQSFDLVAGPIKSEAQARKVCKTLEARGVACRVGNFDGNAL